nr:hypothetical protein Iba_chr09bCG13710 [Ipomoea batatas]
MNILVLIIHFMLNHIPWRIRTHHGIWRRSGICCSNNFLNCHMHLVFHSRLLLPLLKFRKRERKIWIRDVTPGFGMAMNIFPMVRKMKSLVYEEVLMLI